MISRHFALLIVAVACLHAAFDITGSTAEAQLVEAPPSYTNATALRGDASLQAVDFISDSVGIAVGDHGAILRTEDGGQTWQTSRSRVHCRLDDVAWMNAELVVAVGGGYDRITGISRGVVLRSTDAGKTWRQTDASELPRLRKLAYRKEDRVLVARGDWGPSSLSRTFISRDTGRSFANSGERADDLVRELSVRELSAQTLAKWSMITNLNAPIRDVCRASQSRLFAVGDHGVIARSDDSGKNWQHIRGEQRRTAILMIANKPGSVAWPLLGSEALEMGHRTELLVAETKSSIDPTRASPLDLARQAAMSLGAAGADSLGAPTRESIQQWVVVHRPAVLVVDDQLPKSLHSMIIETAISSGVPRVVTYSTKGRGESMLHAAALLPKTGVLAGDLWKDALHTVSPDRTIAAGYSFRRRYDAAASDRRGESVTAGTQVDSGQKLSASLPSASRRELQVVQARVSQPQLIDQAFATSRNADEFSVALDSLLDQTASDDRFRLAWSVLQRARSSSGHTGFQEVALNTVADRFAHTSAGKWAGLRVQSIQNSLEWKRLQIAGTGTSSDPSDSDSGAPPVAEIVAVSPFQSDDSRVVQAGATTPIQVPRVRRLTDAVRKRKPVPIDLSWEFHPLVLIARDAAKSRGDEQELQAPNQQSANLRRLVDDPAVQSWGQLIAGANVIAKAVTTPPQLDGKTNDLCWRGALPAAGRVPVRMAYDENYLYVALQCEASRLRPDGFVRTNSSPVRDHQLEEIDRFELAIDTDRDLLTSMQLAMTDGGRTHDAIDGRDAWNPTWYIASDRDRATITFEIAITRRDITDLPIVPGESWYISSRPVVAGDDRDRTMPRSQDWTRVTFR